MLEKLNLDTDLDKYKRFKINDYYIKMYGIPGIRQSKNKNQRLSFKTAYSELLNHATKNKDMLKKRLDMVNEKHKEQILELEKLKI